MKKYISVNAEFLQDGKILPKSIIWEDDRVFCVDRIYDIRPAASLKAGGAGIRYSCSITGKRKYLFLEENRWFVEM